MTFEINDFEAFDDEEGVNDFGLIGQSRISDGSANTDFQDNVLIYNENFGRTIDIAANSEWTETLVGGSTQTQTSGILTLTAVTSISEKNNGFQINVAGKNKKIRLKTNLKYTGAGSSTASYLGFQSASNFAIYFLKTGASTWAGYIMDEATNEYQTANFTVSASAYHEWEIIFNSNRADFYIDGVLKGTLNGNISVANCNLVFFAAVSVVFDIDWVRVWEAVVPK